MDPIELYRRAAANAAQVLEQVMPEQLTWATPCSEWSVQGLVDHMTGSTEYLNAALAGRVPAPPPVCVAGVFTAGAAQVVTGLAAPGALERMCMSPLGFEWSTGQAVMGTIMDTLIHTWDLATAIGLPVVLDAELVSMCVDTFLPDMPERGREGGIVGPAVAVADGAPAHVRLLGAMGRRE